MKTRLTGENYFQDIAKAALKGVGEGEYLALDYTSEDSQFARFNGAKVRQLGTVTDGSLGLRYHRISGSGAQRTNAASLTLTGDLAADNAAVGALLARLRTECAELPIDPFAEIPAKAATSATSVPGNLPERERAVESLLREARGLDFTGIYASGEQARGMADSKGSRHWFSTGNFVLDYSVYGKEERAYKGTFAGSNWDEAALHREVEGAREKLAALANPIREVKRGNYRTYLAPAAAADLVTMISDGASEMAMRQGDSAFRLARGDGKKRFSNLVTLKDDFRSGTAPRFNEQGELAPEEFTVIEKGALKASLIGARTAKEYKLEANGAARSEVLRAPVLAGGALAENDAIQTLGEGLYLSNLHYLNWSDQQGGRITGMTRFACFWVENGRLASPIQNLRWDDEIFRLFGSELEALTRETYLFPDTSTYGFRSVGAVQVPGMLLKSMQFTL